MKVVLATTHALGYVTQNNSFRCSVWIVACMATQRFCLISISFYHGRLALSGPVTPWRSTSRLSGISRTNVRKHIECFNAWLPMTGPVHYTSLSLYLSKIFSDIHWSPIFAHPNLQECLPVYSCYIICYSRQTNHAVG